MECVVVGGRFSSRFLTVAIITAIQIGLSTAITAFLWL